MSTTTTRPEISVQELEVNVFTIPTDAPEADGTLCWNATTIVVVHVYGGGQRGLGYTYADQATAKLIETMLAGIVEGRDAMAPPAVWARWSLTREISAGQGSPRWRSPRSTSRFGT